MQTCHQCILATNRVCCQCCVRLESNVDSGMRRPNSATARYTHPGCRSHSFVLRMGAANSQGYTFERAKAHLCRLFKNGRALFLFTKQREYPGQRLRGNLLFSNPPHYSCISYSTSAVTMNAQPFKGELRPSIRLTVPIWKCRTQHKPHKVGGVASASG